MQPKKAPTPLYIREERVPIQYATVIKIPAGKTLADVVDYLEDHGPFDRRVLKNTEIVLEGDLADDDEDE